MAKFKIKMSNIPPLRGPIAPARRGETGSKKAASVPAMFCAQFAALPLLLLHPPLLCRFIPLCSAASSSSAASRSGFPSASRPRSAPLLCQRPPPRHQPPLPLNPRTATTPIVSITSARSHLLASNHVTFCSKSASSSWYRNEQANRTIAHTELTHIASPTPHLLNFVLLLLLPICD